MPQQQTNIHRHNLIVDLVQHVLFLFNGSVILLNAILMFRKLTITSVLLGLNLICFGFAIIAFELYHPIIASSLVNFWFTSLIGKSLFTAFLSLVSSFGLWWTAAISFVISLGMLLYAVVVDGKVSLPIWQEDFYVLLHEKEDDDVEDKESSGCDHVHSSIA